MKTKPPILTKLGITTIFVIGLITHIPQPKNLLILINNPQDKVEELLVQATEKYNRGDKHGAIADLTKAIELEPDYYADAYSNRGIVRSELGDR
jgi:tetratricopeptide (TPR) repeat protein